MPSTTTTTTTASSSSMHQKKSRSTKPKLFQCTGFGDCHMVFTRSEHLARHTRKHTGEKPYVCIVPGCSRRFSRFDNMMQHTQTHKSTRNKSPHSSNTETTTTISNYSKNSISNMNTATYEKVPKFIMSNHHMDSSLSSSTATSSVPSPPLLKELHLTQDEFEALQGFGRFRHTPIFIDSFRDLASVVYIEPNPAR
ncbi:uncharacterized protein BX663DRAFT_518210, partial [Cokeromyces recurvatus]|uniref:uncharacterized protein n=1 Tax=Cokeromyces recurvatus TaxID=90255 RepID=UPI00221F362E